MVCVIVTVMDVAVVAIVTVVIVVVRSRCRGRVTVVFCRVREPMSATSPRGGANRPDSDQSMASAIMPQSLARPAPSARLRPRGGSSPWGSSWLSVGSPAVL